ncbi:MAG TPA: NAD-dependent epimerase/dehydratase family protein [Candidatus Angelobacter sp.]|nr:NAD-dependent epimerase/dehydratase family protein [Candidatus Angelobacter sp.]
MRALVSGGAGFIGSHIVDALLAAGHDVCAVDDLSRGDRSRVPAAARLHVVDVRSSALHDVVSAEKPEIVFHQAAQIDVRRSISEPLLDTEINVVGTVNLLQACVSAGVRRVVFASSGGAIYGDTSVIPTPETHPARPASLYGAAKLCGEAYGQVYASLYGLEFCALRYANVYGPRQDPHGEAGVVAIFARKLLSGDIPVINGDGTQTRDYVFVGDVVRANLAAASAGAPAMGAYNVGTGRETDVNELFAMLRDACGVTGEAQHGPGKPGEQRRSCLDASLAASALGWSPKVALEDGLRETVEFFRSAS